MQKILKKDNWLALNPIPLLVDNFPSQSLRNDLTLIEHRHDFDELVIICEGENVHHIDGKEYKVKAGDTFVIRKDQKHFFDHHKNLDQILNVAYNLEKLPLPHDLLDNMPGFRALFEIEPVIRDVHNVISALHLTEKQLSQVKHLWEKMKEEEAEKKPGYALLLISYFMELMTFLARVYSGITTYQGQNILAIEKTIRYLNNHFMETVSISELASQANMSRSSFMRNFKIATDLTPINYLNNIRVEKAARLLLDNKKSITEIGFATGFNSTSYFTTTFRKIMGKPPLEFRKSF